MGRGWNLREDATFWGLEVARVVLIIISSLFCVINGYRQGITRGRAFDKVERKVHT